MKTTFISICLMFNFVVEAQTIEKFSIDSGGLSTSSGGIEILYTLGEVVVAERAVSGILLSEGFINPINSNALGITDTEENKLIIYPNPASKEIHVETPFAIEVIEVYNSLGKNVFNATNVTIINVETWSSGIYFMRLEYANTIVSKKIIVDTN